MNTVSTFPSAAEVAALSGPDLDHALVAIERARREVEAAYVAVLDRADTTNRFAADAHAGVRGWASALTNVGSVELYRRLQTLRAARDLPEIAMGLAAGELGVDQVREIAKLHANHRVRGLTIDGADTLIDHARTKDFVEFSEIIGRWESFGDPEAASQRHEQAHERRDAMVFERDGVVHLHASGGTLQGAALIEIFQRQCDAEFLDDWERANDEGADERSIGEYEQRLAALATGKRPQSVGVDDIDGIRCETDGGIPIDPYDAVMASMVGWFRRVIVDSAGVVIDLRRKRRFTGSARVAVILSRRRCLWPGCGRTSKRNQVDHTHEHSRGGLTTPSNGGPACGRHNRTKNRGYTVHRDANGNWHVHRPDGSELTEPAAA